MSAQRPLELILARNLMSSMSMPGALLDGDGRLLFFNEAAGALLGRSFEDTTGMSVADWTAEFGPFDEHGELLAFHELREVQAMLDHQPCHTVYRIRTHGGEFRRVEMTMLPVGEDRLQGAIVVFWPTEVRAAATDGAGRDDQ